MSASNATRPLPAPPADHGAPRDEEDAQLRALVVATVAHQPGAWSALWTAVDPIIRHIAGSRRWASRLCRSEDAQRDIVAGVMGQLARKDFARLHAFLEQEAARPEGSFRHWIATVAVHATVSYRRAYPEYQRRRVANDGPRWVPLDPLPEDVDEIPASEKSPFTGIDAHRVAERLGPRLGAEQRAALGYWLEEVGPDEIAAKVGLADEKTAMAKVWSGLKRLRVHLAAEDAEKENRPTPVKNRRGVASCPDMGRGSGQAAHLDPAIHRGDAMAATKKPGEARFMLPFGRGKLETVVGKVKTQLAAVSSAPDLPNQPKIKDALTATEADADAVEKTLGQISTAEAALVGLRSTRDKQMFSLRMDHEALQSAINLAGQGDRTYLQTYGGVIVAKGTLEGTDDVPLNPKLTATKNGGEAHAKCKADPKAYAYAYQFGTDPANPDGWPKPEIESGSSYVKTGLTPGQKIYCRIAIYRRGVGIGKWSPVMDVVVH